MQDPKQLEVWRHAHALTLSVYRHTARFPKDERFGLTSQLRRSACSIPSNLVEGIGRRRDRELLRFLSYALGSACELEYQLLLASELGYLEQESARQLRSEAKRVGMMLNAFYSHLAGRLNRIGRPGA